MNKHHEAVQALIDPMGIELNGPNPWDPQVHDDRFYARVMAQGSLGLGESYMDGWWDCDALDQFFTRILRGDVRKNMKLDWNMVKLGLTSVVKNRQTRSRAKEVGEKHYDVGNDLYERMLDKRMVYTCGYWKEAENLDEAQEAKYELACRKIGLKKGDRVLDIGCGWGSFAKYAAEKHGAEVVGITISKEQQKLAQEVCKGLPVEIRLQDYRDVNEPFDHIVSFGMIEHVGYKNYREYMEVAERNLKDDGLFLLHTIGASVSAKATDPWIEKYIFTNSMLPSIAQLSRASEKLFTMEDWHNFGQDYDTTLMAWHENFVTHWEEIKDQYSERFYRMWCYYLLSCAGSFRSRRNQLWQIVFSKRGVVGGYTPVR